MLDLVAQLAIPNVPTEVYQIAPKARLFIPAMRSAFGLIGWKLPTIAANDLPRSPEHLKDIIASHLYEQPTEALADLVNSIAYQAEQWLDEYANSLAESQAQQSDTTIDPSQITSYGDVPASDATAALTQPPEEIASDGSRAHDDAAAPL